MKCARMTNIGHSLTTVTAQWALMVVDGQWAVPFEAQGEDRGGVKDSVNVGYISVYCQFISLFAKIQ